MIRVLQTHALPLGYVAVSQYDTFLIIVLQGADLPGTACEGDCQDGNEFMLDDQKNDNDLPDGASDNADADELTSDLQTNPLDTDDTLVDPPLIEIDLTESASPIVVDERPPADMSWMEFGGALEGDIDAALAAVSSLGFDADDTLLDVDEPIDDLDSDDEAYTADSSDVDTLSIPSPAVADRRRPAVRRVERYVPHMRMPARSALRRGSPGSVIPALLLIGVGAWLTVTTTTGGKVEPLLLIGISVGGVVLSLFAYWISSGRWSRGALFAAALIALAAGVVIFSIAPIQELMPDASFTGIDLTRGYPLLISAVGVAFIVSAILARSVNRNGIAPGIVLLAAGIIGTLITLEIIPGDLLQTIAPLWFVPLVILIILWLIPLVFRLRDRR